MAFVHQTVQVPITKIKFIDMPKGTGKINVLIQNNQTTILYIGDFNVAANVGANGGRQIAAGGTLTLELNGGDQVWAITTGSPTGWTNIVYSGT